MNALLGRIEASSDRQNRFVSDASHELRSPLARVRTRLEVGLRRPHETDWPALARQLTITRDVWTMDRPAVFSPAKDRPVLFTAAAWARVLLTLDAGDFGGMMPTGFYHLAVLKPGAFLERERAAGWLK